MTHADSGSSGGFLYPVDEDTYRRLVAQSSHTLDSTALPLELRWLTCPDHAYQFPARVEAALQSHAGAGSGRFHAWNGTFAFALSIRAGPGRYLALVHDCQERQERVWMRLDELGEAGADPSLTRPTSQRDGLRRLLIRIHVHIVLLADSVGRTHTLSFARRVDPSLTIYGWRHGVYFEEQHTSWTDYMAAVRRHGMPVL